MTAAPIYDETIPIRTAAFGGFPTRAGIDRGCSLTKIAFVPKDAPSDTDTVPLRCLTFRNADFEDALRVMTAQAQLPDKGELHVTGASAAFYKDTIKDIVGLDAVIENELESLACGVRLMIDNVEPGKVFYPAPKVKELNFRSGMFGKVFEIKKDKIVDHSEGSVFPALVLHAGSSDPCLIAVSAQGEIRTIGRTALSGRSFLGLAGVMLDTSDFNEIVELANEGDQCKVDYQIRDIMKNDPDSPVGQYPSDLPVFPFSKASDVNWSRDSCRNEDLAASVISLFAHEYANFIFLGVKETGITRVYLTGNFFRGELMRHHFFRVMSIYSSSTNFDLNIISSGHVKAISATLRHSDQQ